MAFLETLHSYSLRKLYLKLLTLSLVLISKTHKNFVVKTKLLLFSRSELNRIWLAQGTLLLPKAAMRITEASTLLASWRQCYCDMRITIQYY